MRIANVGLALMAGAVLLTPGCGGESPSGGDELPLVVTSIFPVGDLTARLAGDAARVEVILPPGTSPATFEVTPRQLRDFSTALLFVMVGGGLDEWVTEISKNAAGGSRMIRVSDGLTLMAGDDHEHESGNPHIWLDPILVRDHVLPKLSSALEDVFPGRADGTRERAARLADSLTALDREVREAMQSLERRSFVATHPAWSYFAHRYGLEEVGVIHAHPGEEPSSREMAQLLETARTHEIHCLFMEPQIGEVAGRALATELDLPTCLLDPLGGPDMEDRSSYMDLIRFNTRQFVRGLRGDGP